MIIIIIIYIFQALFWFPTTISDLDERANEVLEGGKDLQADHPVNCC